MSLRFNERTANPGVVFWGPPSGLIGGLPAPLDRPTGEAEAGIGKSGPAARVRDVAPARAKIGRCAVVVRDFHRRRSLFRPTQAALRINRPVNVSRRISSISGPSILFTRRPRVVR